MCLIVDANAGGKLLVDSSSPVLKWLLGDRGEPRLVSAGKLHNELIRNERVRRLLVALSRSGRLRIEAAASLSAEERLMKKLRVCVSNDVHVLALARVSGARTLATFDEALTEDFRNAAIIHRPRGKVYRDHDVHAKLLCHTPQSCGVRLTPKRKKRR
ncbi:MAG: hypothetical protein K2X35_01660 [Bryobacteraceae bacterium]|nr:hypothetical protein [Bryobacteraceae bacterium]